MPRPVALAAGGAAAPAVSVRAPRGCPGWGGGGIGGHGHGCRPSRLAVRRQRDPSAPGRSLRAANTWGWAEGLGNAVSSRRRGAPLSALRGFALTAVPQRQGSGQQAPGTSGEKLQGEKQVYADSFHSSIFRHLSSCTVGKMRTLGPRKFYSLAPVSLTISLN